MHPPQAALQNICFRLRPIFPPANSRLKLVFGGILQDQKLHALCHLSRELDVVGFEVLYRHAFHPRDRDILSPSIRNETFCRAAVKEWRSLTTMMIGLTTTVVLVHAGVLRSDGRCVRRKKPRHVAGVSNLRTNPSARYDAD
jgi:hypothetical protein